MSDGGTNNDSFGFVGEVRVMTPLFSCVDVRDMELYEGNGNTEEGIPNRDRCVGETPGVQDNPIGTVCACFLDLVDKGTFPVASSTASSVSIRNSGLEVFVLTFGRSLPRH